MNKQSKTGRRYGALLECIRAVARAGKPFTAEAVPAERRRVVAQLQNMTATGELLRVVPGRRGRFGHRSAVFILNDKLRDGATERRPSSQET